MGIAERSIASVTWNVAVSIVQVMVGFARSILLARWLPVEVFGVYGMASSIVMLSVVVARFGMANAFLHRAPETEDEDQAAAVYFSLQLIFASVWAVLLALGAFVFASGQSRTALLALTFIQAGVLLVETPRTILVRRVVHRRLALIRLANIVLSAVVALSLARLGAGLWALISMEIITLVVGILFLYVWRPVWRPRLIWSPPGMRYFLRFGSRDLMATALLKALDRVDDLWTGAYLGKRPLGFYSRSYAFATYPRVFLAASVNKVAGGTYAELKGNRKQLSQAFFRANAFLVRSGFFLAGLLALVAPEFVRLFLGAKWLPMLDAFRLMLVFTLLDPVKTTVANLFVAVGRPGEVVRARTVQLVVMVVGLFVLGLPLGITGVALAVDLMLVVGVIILLWKAQSYVDFSLGRLFIAPGLGLVASMLLARSAMALPGVLESDWRTGFVKTAVFAIVYGATLLALEGRQLFEMLSFFAGRISTNGR